MAAAPKANISLPLLLLPPSLLLLLSALELVDAVRIEATGLDERAKRVLTAVAAAADFVAMLPESGSKLKCQAQIERVEFKYSLVH